MFLSRRKASPQNARKNCPTVASNEITASFLSVTFVDSSDAACKYITNTALKILSNCIKMRLRTSISSSTATCTGCLKHYNLHDIHATSEPGNEFGATWDLKIHYFTWMSFEPTSLCKQQTSRVLVNNLGGNLEFETVYYCPTRSQDNSVQVSNVLQQLPKLGGMFKVDMQLTRTFMNSRLNCNVERLCPRH